MPFTTRHTKIAIYLRISDDRKGEEEGVDRQREDCLRRADREGWTVTRVYVDNDCGASRYSRKPRPQYAEMLRDAGKRKFEVILGYSNSRLTRRPMELEDLIQLHERTGMQISTIVSGDDDLSTADGRMVARIKASVDAGEAERIAERVQRARLRAAERGRRHGGRRPFGWNKDGSPNSTEFDALREGIISVRDGASIRSVARAWDAAGLRTATGRLFVSNLTNTRQVLVRWRNAGIRVHRGEPLFDVETSWTPVCTREELEELHHRLSDRKRRANGGRVALSALMGGIAQCGKCGAPLRSASHERSHKDPTRVPNYRCSRGTCVNIRRTDLDEAVLEALITELLSNDMDVLIDSAEDRAEIRHVRAERDKLSLRATELAAEFGSGNLTLAEFRAARAALQGQLAATEARAEELNSRLAVADFVTRERDLLGLSDESRDAEADGLLARVEALELHRKRELIISLFTIVVHPVTAENRIVITTKATGTVIAHQWKSAVTFTDPADES